MTKFFYETVFKNRKLKFFIIKTNKKSYKNWREANAELLTFNNVDVSNLILGQEILISRKFLDESHLQLANLKKEIKELFLNLNFSFETHKITKSPFSNSFYIIEKNEEITWNYKPNNCLRISDHWNFKTDKDERIHCPLNKKNTKNFVLAKWNEKSKTFKYIKTLKTK